MLKAECRQCEKGEKPYVVRIAAGPAREIGPPHCPRHGAMKVEFPPDDDDELLDEEMPEETNELREAV
jgi:hypothetical protein